METHRLQRDKILFLSKVAYIMFNQGLISLNYRSQLIFRIIG